jgi:transketolase
MAAIMNGIALHGALIPYGGTFLTFSDYCRNALRMAALMRIRSIFVFTHDSIGLGEDGPTHQPIEHLASLRLIPGLDVWRPCDTEESVVAWVAALERQDGPACLVFSRQNLPFQQRAPAVRDEIQRGGYVLVESSGEPHAVIIATGSEVSLAVEAQKLLTQQGIAVRVVSMPSTTVFDRQDAHYRDGVLPPLLPTVAVEAGVSDFWHKYVGRTGTVVGIDRFGESAPAGELFKLFGLTAERVAKAVRALLA